MFLLLAFVAATVAVGLVLRARSGRMTARASGPDLRPLLAGLGEAGTRATLLQFSSAFCAPCRATRRILGDLATGTDGVTHVEVDAEQHLALVRQLGIVTTPTTLVLDAAGREVRRAAGAPSRAQVLQALPS